MTETPWYERPIAAFDLETTGPDPRTARVVTASICLIDGKTVEKLNWLADPGGSIPEGATEVHGITTEHAKEFGRPHKDVVAEVADTLKAAWSEGFVVVAFNASYDLTVMDRVAPGFTVDGVVLDPYVIDRALDKFRSGKRKLVDVCAHYGVKQEDAHEAEGDALAAARLAYKMSRLPRVVLPGWRKTVIDWPRLRELSDEGVMVAQAEWQRERQLSFIDYLKEQGKPFDEVSTEWPVLPRRHTVAA